MSENQEIYWNENCPKCGVINKFWAGRNDVEVYKCYNCSHLWYDEIVKEWLDDPIEDGFMCKGSPV